MFRRTLASALVASSLTACGAEPETAFDDTIATEEESITRARVEPAVWNQGSDPIDLGPATDRVCFLTGMQGAFEGG